MSEQQASQPAAERVYERCLCREALDRFEDLFHIHSDEARTHLRNSRLEFLMAIRSLIDDRIIQYLLAIDRVNDRIAHLSATPQQGTKVSVE